MHRSLLAGIAFATLLSSPASTPPRASSAEFIRQLDATVPAFLHATGVPGATVALVHNGEIAGVRAYGVADERHRATTTDAIFNVGSISKTVTAWGVMRLVERGVIGLDDPVERYLRRWHLPSSKWNPDGVTIRRLLSHTAGLSLPSVHEYSMSERFPSLVESLSDSVEGVKQIAEGGSSYSYSGGGYEILQLLIEDVTGRSFTAYMRDEVLIPLGMRSSSFDVNTLDQSRVATPYDSGRAIPLHRYVGLAPAGLYSTAGDLAKFVAAELRGPHGEAPGRGVLSPTTVAVMHTPAPSANSGFGFHYGLGHNLFPLGDSFGPLKILGDGALVPGHMGQNTGWGAVIWSNPGTGDGFVMLTNHSSGYNAYRWALCDWVRWAAAPSFGTTCRDRDKQPMGPIGAALYASEPKRAVIRLPFVDSLAKGFTTDSTPGMAVLVMRDGKVVHSAGYGVADLATGARITRYTPFYLASVTKEFTAFGILRLAQQGLLSLNDPLSRYLPEVGGPISGVTIRQLLTHSSGVPDYYSFIQDWSYVPHLNNMGVVDTLKGKALRFPPGTSTEYSNSGYVLLAQVVQRITKHPFGDAMSRLVFKPAGMTSTIALEDSVKYPQGRAVGYYTSGTHYLLSDYGAFESAKGARTYTDLRTVGAGGIYSTLDDLASWERFLEAPPAADRALLEESTRVQQRPDDVKGVDSVSGYGYGWIVSRRYNTDVVWHDGGFAGFRNIILRVPSKQFAVVVLSNSPLVDQHRIAVAIADHYLK